MAKPTDPPPPDRMAEIELVVGRARAGDPGAVPRLRELLDEYPELWEGYGDLSRQAAEAWVDLAAGTDLLFREAMLRKVAALRAELAGDRAGPVAGLLADRAVATWFEVNYHAAMEAKALAGPEGPRLLAYRAKRRTQAERAHQAALVALASVRKLLPARADGAARASGKPAAAVPDLANRISAYLSDPPTARRLEAAVN